VQAVCISQWGTPWHAMKMSSALHRVSEPTMTLALPPCPPQVHGFPKVMGVLTHLDSFTDQKALKKTKKRLKVRLGCVGGGSSGDKQAGPGGVGGEGGRVACGQLSVLLSVTCV
jgi:hypothetical protein